MEYLEKKSNKEITKEDLDEINDVNNINDIINKELDSNTLDNKLINLLTEKQVIELYNNKLIDESLLKETVSQNKQVILKNI